MEWVNSKKYNGYLYKQRSVENSPIQTNVTHNTTGRNLSNTRWKNTEIIYSLHGTIKEQIIEFLPNGRVLIIRTPAFGDITRYNTTFKYREKYNDWILEYPDTKWDGTVYTDKYKLYIRNGQLVLDFDLYSHFPPCTNTTHSIYYQL